MQTGQRVYRDCLECSTTGKLYKSTRSAYPVNAVNKIAEDTYTEVDCHKCDGVGIIPWGWLRDDKETTMPGEEA